MFMPIKKNVQAAIEKDVHCVTTAHAKQMHHYTATQNLPDALALPAVTHSEIVATMDTSRNNKFDVSEK